MIPTVVGFVTIVLCMLPFALFKGNNLRSQSSFLELKLSPLEGSKINTQN